MSRANHRARLAELKALRESGKKAFDSYRVDDVDNLYDEVDEDGYKKIVRERLNEDDFVVDDNGEGYADDGREDWDRVRRYDSDSEADDMPVRGRPSKAGLCPGSSFCCLQCLTKPQPRRTARTSWRSATPVTETSANTSPKARARPNQSPRYVVQLLFLHIIAKLTLDSRLSRPRPMMTS